MNKTITKRLLSLVLLVVMLVGCALPAYAADTGASGDLTAVYAQEGTSYKDGVYEGTGKGFKNGEIKVKVTITDGKIAKVELVSQEKQSYWETMNVASLFDDIVKANGTEIDGVSGATMSSNGVKAAVNDALSKALVTEPEQPDTGIFAAGTGAKSDPYLIRTVDQLKAFAASVNGEPVCYARRRSRPHRRELDADRRRQRQLQRHLQRRQPHDRRPDHRHESRARRV